MRTVRKLLAFMLAVGLMVSAMSVLAANESGKPVYSDVESNSAGGWTYTGSTKPNESNVRTSFTDKDWWHNTGDGQWYFWNGSDWTTDCGNSDSDDDDDSDSRSPEEIAAEERAAAEQAQMRAAQEQASIDAVRLAGAASDEGFADVGDMYRAAEKSMSAGEFYNNAVVSTPGIENAVTVGQGGNLVVNGQVTNMSATISKVTNRAYVDSVRIEQEGRVLNVVDVSYPAVEATINFYMPGVTAENAIVALQYNGGRWVNVEVVEVRADHVTLNMKGNGVVAFIAQ